MYKDLAPPPLECQKIFLWLDLQVLQLLLQTFMSFESSSTAADNAAVLQLFLETYFMELLSQRQLLMDVEVPHFNKYFRNLGEVEVRVQGELIEY